MELRNRWKPEQHILPTEQKPFHILCLVTNLFRPHIAAQLPLNLYEIKQAMSVETPGCIQKHIVYMLNEFC